MQKVLIVDDHEVLRDGVKKLLDEQPDAITWGEAGTPDEALVRPAPKTGTPWSWIFPWPAAAAWKF